ncbi:HNH endonuclease [Vibrio phage K406]
MNLQQVLDKTLVQKQKLSKSLKAIIMAYNEPIPFSIGDIYTSKNFGDMEVISNEGSRNVGVKFLNTGHKVYGLQRGNVVRGNVKDVFVPTVEGIGYLGTPRYVARLPAYHCWKHMLVRCYSENYHSTRETCSDCSVTDSWHNFCNFEKWYNENVVEGYHLDKDLIVQGNRVYSPETCCFIPPMLNGLIVEKGKLVDGCEVGVSKRRKKGSSEYNGLYNVQYAGVYLARTENVEEANSLYKEFKKLHFEELADKLEQSATITPFQAEKLRSRKV